MSKTLTKIDELTARVPEADRAAIESKLVETAETLVAAFQFNTAARNRITERSLEDIAAGRVFDLADFEARLDAVLDELAV